MRKTLLSIAAVATLALAGSASAQDSTLAPQPADGGGGSRASRVDPDRVICARVLLSNSRIPRRICRSMAEWEVMGGLPDAR